MIACDEGGSYVVVTMVSWNGACGRSGRGRLRASLLLPAKVRNVFRLWLHLVLRRGTLRLVANRRTGGMPAGNGHRESHGEVYRMQL